MEGSRNEKKKKQQLEKENTNTQKNKKQLPSVWFSLKKSLHCKSDTSDVHDPSSRRKEIANATLSTKRSTCRSGCSRSIANLKDVIHGSNRHFEKPTTTTCSSPRSIGSSEFLNPITHEVIISNSTSELKITAAGGGDVDSPTGARGFVGTLRPGTPVHYSSSNGSQASRKASSERDRGGVAFKQSRRDSEQSRRDSAVVNGDDSSVSCHKCGEKFSKLEAAEAHHLSKHAGNDNKVSYFKKVSYFTS